MSSVAIAASTAVTLLINSTGPALAHAPIEGIGSFYNGLLHPLLVPSHLLVLISLGLLLGQNGPRPGRWGWFAFVVALSTGLVAGQLLSATVPEAALFALVLAAGLLVCRDAPIAAAPFVALAGAGGFGVGLDTAPNEVATREIWVPLTGTAIGGVLFVSYSGGLVARATREWHRIGARVAGSWTAACAGIALAFCLAGQTIMGQD